MVTWSNSDFHVITESYGILPNGEHLIKPLGIVASKTYRIMRYIQFFHAISEVLMLYPKLADFNLKGDRFKSLIPMCLSFQTQTKAR